MFSSFGFSGLPGWDAAEVNRLEQNAFSLDDEITDDNLASDTKWSKEYEAQIFDTVAPVIDGLTISDFD